MAGKKVYINPNQPDSHQATNWAGITFLSFKQKDTIYNTDGQVDSTNSMAVTNYTVVSDIIRVTVNHNKSSYLSTAEATLSSGDLNYQSIINPGDHALIWIHNDIGQFDRVMGAAALNHPANDYNSGLKFIGRVNSVRTMYNTAGTGPKTIRYMVTFKGFYELGTQAYYNRFLSPDVKSNQGNAELVKAAEVLAQLSHEFNAFFFESEKRSISVQSILAFIMAIFLGTGPDKNAQTIADVVRSPNRAFMVPQELLSILGLKAANDKAPSYVDILHSFLGIQSYKGGLLVPDFSETVKPPVSTKTRRFTPNPIYGNMMALPDNFNNVPIWTLLQQYSNLSLNEVFTSIRVNEKNKIVPVFTARQIPFTTEHIQDRFTRMNLSSSAATGIAYTRFLELPRWVIDSGLMINSFNIGTSDAGRFNFYQVYGQLQGAHFTDPLAAQQAQIKAGNYQIEVTDISRNGLRSFVTNSAVDLTVQGSGNLNDTKVWAALISDWYANNHLKLSGSAQFAGIAQPIAVGDNVQITNKLFHIEEVTHMYEVQGEAPAHKTFYTQVGISNGILIDASYEIGEGQLRESLKNKAVPGYSDEEIYINGQSIVSGARHVKDKKRNNT